MYVPFKNQQLNTNRQFTFPLNAIVLLLITECVILVVFNVVVSVHLMLNNWVKFLSVVLFNENSYFIVQDGIIYTVVQNTFCFSFIINIMCKAYSKINFSYFESEHSISLFTLSTFHP